MKTILIIITLVSLAIGGGGLLSALITRIIEGSEKKNSYGVRYWREFWLRKIF